MSDAHLKKIELTKLLTAVILTAASASSFAGDLGFDDDEGPNSDFYSQAYNEKLSANNLTAKELSQKAKALVAAAHRSHHPKKLATYEDFSNRLKEAVLNSRKAAEPKCQRLALRFQKLSARASAVANCRTETEVQLERQLQAFQIELKRIAD